MRTHDFPVNRRTILRGTGVRWRCRGWNRFPPGVSKRRGRGSQAFPKRFATLFMGNGINPNHWWAKGAGQEMELSKTLQPMAPLRAKLNVVSGLFNKQSTGVGIHPGQTGNILSGAALQKGAVLRGGVSMDQVLAGHLGEETPQPSLVLGCEQPITGYHETNFSMAYSSHISWQDATLAGPDGGLPVLGLRQSLRQPREPASSEHPGPRQGRRRGARPAGRPCRSREARRVPFERTRRRKTGRCKPERLKDRADARARDRGRPPRPCRAR